MDASEFSSPAATNERPNSPEPLSGPGYSLWQLVVYALKPGTLGFGGPVALVGYMHRDLVEARKWISEADYKEGLTLAQLVPGPLAAQLAMYLGYVHYGNLGATLVGIAFVVPSFVMVVLIGIAYVAYGGLTWMQAVFYGVGACVIGIIAISAYKLTTKSIGKDKLLWAIYLIAAAVTVITESELVSLFLIAGVLVWLVRAPPKQWFGGVVTAAAIGTITGAVIVLGKRSITDLPTLLLAVVTVVLIWKFKKLPEPVIVLAAALIGLVVYPLMKP